MGAIKWAYTKDLDSLKSEFLTKNSINTNFIPGIYWEERKSGLKIHMLYSINYDRILYRSKLVSLTGNMGSYIFPYSSRISLQPELALNILIGKLQNYFEMSTGVIFPQISDFNKWVAIGYRYQPVGKGFLLKAGFHLLRVNIFDGYWILYTPGIRLAIGYGFNTKRIRKNE